MFTPKYEERYMDQLTRIQRWEADLQGDMLFLNQAKVLGEKLAQQGVHGADAFGETVSVQIHELEQFLEEQLRDRAAVAETLATAANAVDSSEYPGPAADEHGTAAHHHSSLPAMAIMKSMHDLEVDAFFVSNIQGHIAALTKRGLAIPEETGHVLEQQQLVTLQVIEDGLKKLTDLGDALEARAPHVSQGHDAPCHDAVEEDDDEGEQEAV
jgi:hypothetical protein